MQFMLLCAIDESKWNALATDERDSIMDRYLAWVEKYSMSGHHVGGGKLDDSCTATTLRTHKEKTVHTDGPFAETREQIGGFHILECGDREEALRIAREIPTLSVGGIIEVRPMLYALHS